MGFVKITIISVVSLGALGAVGYGLAQTPMGQQYLGGPPEEERGTMVRLQAAELGDLKRTVSAPGSIEPRTNVQISSQVSAKVIALPFREGERVEKGDVVVRLDPQDLIAGLDSARAGVKRQEASLKGAEAGLINARLQYERLQSLHETGDATKAELDGSEASFLQAQANIAQIEASIEEAQARIEEAQKDLDNVNITSSMTGVVTALNTEVGETVIVGTTNNPGSIIMEIADLSEMLLKASVDETNIAPIEIGQPATVYINAYPDREYSGTVKNIGLKRQVASDGTGTFEVTIPIVLEEGETLYTGLTASTDIAVEHFYDMVKVPSQAVLDRRVEELPREIRDNDIIEPGKTFARVVYTVEDGKTVATPVEAGPSDLTHTVLTDGLEAGEKIVVGPYRALIKIEHDEAVTDMNAEKDEPGEENGEGGEDDADDAEDGDEAGDGSDETGDDESADGEDDKNKNKNENEDTDNADEGDAGDDENDDAGTDTP